MYVRLSPQNIVMQLSFCAKMRNSRIPFLRWNAMRLWQSGTYMRDFKPIKWPINLYTKIRTEKRRRKKKLSPQKLRASTRQKPSHEINMKAAKNSPSLKASWFIPFHSHLCPVCGVARTCYRYHFYTSRIVFSL